MYVDCKSENHLAVVYLAQVGCNLLFCNSGKNSSEKINPQNLLYDFENTVMRYFVS